MTRMRMQREREERNKGLQREGKGMEGSQVLEFGEFVEGGGEESLVFASVEEPGRGEAGEKNRGGRCETKHGSKWMR